MGRQSTLEITESSSELRTELKRCKNSKSLLKLQCLLLLKEEKFRTRLELSSHLGIHIRTMERWLTRYSTGGLKPFLASHHKGNQKKIISKSLHQKLELKLKDSTSPLQGYWHAVQWIKGEGVDIKYNTLRTYMIRHFGTKLKAPRKSHYKKDEQAIEAFKKTT